MKIPPYSSLKTPQKCTTKGVVSDCFKWRICRPQRRLWRYISCGILCLPYISSVGLAGSYRLTGPPGRQCFAPKASALGFSVLVGVARNSSVSGFRVLRPLNQTAQKYTRHQSGKSGEEKHTGSVALLQSTIRRTSANHRCPPAPTALCRKTQKALTPRSEFPPSACDPMNHRSIRTEQTTSPNEPCTRKIKEQSFPIVTLKVMARILAVPSSYMFSPTARFNNFW